MEYVGPIARQPVTRVDEIIGIAPENDACWNGWRRDRTDLCTAGSCPAGRQQSGCSREGIGPERLPAVGSPFIDDQRKAVVRHLVPILIRQQKAAIVRLADELVVDERDQLLEGTLVALSPFEQSSGDLRVVVSNPAILGPFTNWSPVPAS
jgi:hypothetical protein